jgi:hypothetical protein
MHFFLKYNHPHETDDSKWKIPVRIADEEALDGLLPCNQRNLILYAI